MLLAHTNAELGPIYILMHGLKRDLVHVVFFHDVRQYASEYECPRIKLPMCCRYIAGDCFAVNQAFMKCKANDANPGF